MPPGTVRRRVLVIRIIWRGPPGMEEDSGGRRTQFNGAQKQHDTLGIPHDTDRGLDVLLASSRNEADARTPPYICD